MLSRAITGHKGLHAMAVFLSALMVSSSEISIEVIPPNPTANQNIILRVIGLAEEILYSDWYRGNEISAPNQIIRRNSDGSINRGAKYFPRATIQDNGSLAITNVTKDLEGNYTVFIQGGSKAYQETVNVLLSVSPVPSNMFKIEVVPPEPSIGQTVTLNVTNLTEQILYSDWYQGNENTAPNQIIRRNSDGSINRGAKYFPRATIQDNGSLMITNVTKELEGNYTVFIQGTSQVFQQTVTLKLSDNQQSPNSGLNGGEIAGIVIGVLALIAGVAGFGVWYSKKESGPL